MRFFRVISLRLLWSSAEMIVATNCAYSPATILPGDPE